MGLAEYQKKRNFKKTREPAATEKRSGRQSQTSKKKNHDPIFVVQEHWASHLHYDFRLEAFGTLKSWAVPKGPSTAIGDKRLAVEVEDHPLAYAKFKGRIPQGQYGAGVVKIWDHGTWNPPEQLGASLEKGHLEFELHGKKLKGRWLLQRTKQTSSHKNQWLLIKRHDPVAKLAEKKLTKKTKHNPWPGFVEPQLAKLEGKVPSGTDWLHEIKFDGYRTQIHIRENLKKSSVQMLTRSGLDWTHKYAPLDQEFKKLKINSAILDGELVALDEKGNSSFSLLQNAIKAGDMSAAVFYVFDLLYVDGEDLRDLPLESRKLRLQDLLAHKPSKKIIFSEHWRGHGDELFKKACNEGLEGIISKDRNSSYSSGRSALWQKVKSSLSQEFVIGGYTDPEGGRPGFGALLMGAYESKKFRYLGRVGTGYNSENLNALSNKLKKFSTKSSPFTLAGPARRENIHWVRPELVAEIEFKAWTGDGVLRHASFKGLREDKKAANVHVERAETKLKKNHGARQAKKKVSGPSKNISHKTTTGFRITHPERIVYSDPETTKLDVAQYYKTVSPWLLPHVVGRPLSLLRCPDHAGENCFFQKHVDNSKLTAVRESLVRDQKIIFIDSEEALLQLVQWNMIELHTWQSHVDRPLFADQLVFDLDPDGAVRWSEISKTALRVKDLLERVQLKSFVKTTGGKGLHLHVPIEPRYDWDSVKAFTKTIAQQLDSEYPGHYTTNLLKKNRKNKIFIDYLRNGFGATAIAPYSLRSKSRPTVAVPLSWTELEKLRRADDFDLSSTLKRLAAEKQDPWKSFFSLSQKIKILDRK